MKINPAKSDKKSFLFILKLALTVGLCGVIIWNVDWKGTWEALAQVNPIIICIVFGGMILNVAASTLKWKILLSIHGILFRFGQLFKYYFTASFFNNFLPSTIGGDSYRIYKTFNNPVSRAGAVTSVLMERLTGISALIFVGFIGGIIGYLQTGNNISRLVMFGGIFGGAGLIIIMVIMFLSASTLQRIAGKLIPPKYQKILTHLHDFRQHYREMWIVILLSMFFQGFLIFYRLLLVNAFGASMSFGDMAVVIALSTIVALVPVSINGFGLLDGSFIYLLTNFSASYEQAFVAILLIRLLNLPLALIGGVYYFFDKKSLQVNKERLSEFEKSRRAV